MPLIIPAISAGAGLFGAINQKRATDKANALSQQQVSTQAGLANTLAQYSADQYQLGKPALSTAMGMYQRLATGNRGDIMGQLAPDINRATEASAGVGNYLNQQGIRGGVRDTQLAENQRQLVGNIGMMPFLARQNAIQGLGELGSRTVGGATSAMGGAISGAGAAAGNQMGLGGQRFYQGEVQDQHIADFGSSLAGMIIPYLFGQKGKGGGGSGGNYAPGDQWGYG